jgi:hypothetical protein
VLHRDVFPLVAADHEFVGETPEATHKVERIAPLFREETFTARSSSRSAGFFRPQSGWSCETLT